MLHRVLAAALSLFALTVVVASAQAPARRTALQGVYTNEQATYGEFVYSENCASCHAGDLSGRADANGDAAPLKGEEFYRRHRTKPLGDLFNFLKANMPADGPGRLRDTDYAAVIAYILSWNDFPAGQTELPSTPAELNQIWLEAEGAAAVTNFSLVHVVACLTQTNDGSWTASRASAPALTAVANPAAQPLGSETFRLMNPPGTPDALKGQKVTVTGILIQEPAGNRLNVQSLSGVAASC